MARLRCRDFQFLDIPRETGADEAIRTLDFNLGKAWMAVAELTPEHFFSLFYSGLACAMVRSASPRLAFNGFLYASHMGNPCFRTRRYINLRSQ
ncbi:hypothetical protein [Sandaracinobacteroides saxicola]|uniref:Uncharacterized protein n=1 Tax=Sandaracinobacteroides saxicola TaxID=2759707 RepID=A0A7G5IK85_9SPHN|nr:hypothetical protein [Sandaracinobacteroides saxicola]QMW23777.1 hypothetical protein H3309_04660 [Sandaracinobacteroides saxicola]